MNTINEEQTEKDKKNMLLLLETACKELGAAGHKKWFEEQFCLWMEMTLGYRNFHKEKAYLESLKENQVEGYGDEDFLQMILDGGHVNNSCIFLVWYTRDIIGRRLRVDRGTQVGKAYLRELYVGSWNESAREKKEYPVRFTMAMECVEVIGSEGESDYLITEEEKVVLGKEDTVLLRLCIENGFLKKEKAEEYIDFALKKKCRKVLPLLISFKDREA